MLQNEFSCKLAFISIQCLFSLKEELILVVTGNILSYFPIITRCYDKYLSNHSYASSHLCGSSWHKCFFLSWLSDSCPNMMVLKCVFEIFCFVWKEQKMSAYKKGRMSQVIIIMRNCFFFNHINKRNVIKRKIFSWLHPV